MNSKSLGPSPPPPPSPPRTTHSWCISLNWVFLISMGQRRRKFVRGLARGPRLLCQGTWPSSCFIELWFTEVKTAPSIQLGVVVLRKFIEWQFLAADLFPDQLWDIASIHFQNTPIHPSPEEKGGKKTFPSAHACGLWLPVPGKHPSVCLWVFHFQQEFGKKKIRNLLSLSSLLLTNQPVCRKFETTVKYLKSSEAQGGTLRWVTIECVWKEEVWPSQPQPPSHYHLKFGFLGQFLFTPIEQACCFLIYWWEDC